MGSATHIVDEAGSVQNRYEYDAWGNITAQEEQVPNRFTYYGQQIDPVTQQYYLRARFYNPVVGRFTQEDTYRGDGLNLYAYCINNPVRYADFNGQDKVDAWTKGLEAEAHNRYMPDGQVMVDVSELPGINGIQVEGRLTPEQMRFLQNEYGVEFALVYHYGPGPNGGGGTYMLYSGGIASVNYTHVEGSILIYHTHPGGAYLPTASDADLDFFKYLKSRGSPQNFSTIVPADTDYLTYFNGEHRWK